jgi:nucleotide-binding universal stress UspA family protein
MKWIVGLDLNPHAHGVLQLTRWLERTSGAPEGERFVGVHVLEEEHLRAVLRTHHMDEVTQAARAAADTLLEREGASASVRELDVVQDVEAEDGLEAARERHAADAIIVGRRAGREGHGFFRLGRVCRRLLRDLPVPLVITPPDLEATQLGDGPIAVLTKLTDDSAGAGHFAQALARRLGRPLAVVHVVADHASFLSGYLAGHSDEAMQREARERGEKALTAWIASAGLTADPAVVLQGGIVERTLEFADEHRVPLFVVGSRHHSAVEQVVDTSVARELAAASRVPVVVVPPRGATAEKR